MDNENNLMWYNGYMPSMMQPCMDCKNYDGNMLPPYMYGKCVNNGCVNNGYVNNPNFMPYNTANESFNKFYRSDMMMNPYQFQNLEPIENMCPTTYNILIVTVKQAMQKIIMENMGMMPKAISKDKFNNYLNDIMCDIMKDETITNKLFVRENENIQETQEDVTRGMCPNCNMLLKDTLAILLITELMKGGCSSCY